MEYIDSAKGKIVDLIDSAEALIPASPLVRYGAVAVIVGIYLFAPNIISDTPMRDLSLDVAVFAIVSFLLYPLQGALISLGGAAIVAFGKMLMRGGIYQ
jgi:hypothetical protein